VMSSMPSLYQISLGSVKEGERRFSGLVADQDFRRYRAV
jgi:hypothetical protein